MTVRRSRRWTDQEILHSDISPKSRPLAFKSPAQSLDYRANSYHIHLSTLGFHGCGNEISQICPCPFCPINTSFSGTPSSCHSTAQNLFSQRRHHPRFPRSPTKAFLHQPQSLRSSPLRRDGHQLRCSWGQFTILSPLLLPYPCSSAIHLIEHSSPFFFCSSFYP